MAPEIAEQLNWEMPDYLAISVGDGCTIAGVWKGFKDLYAIGFIHKAAPAISAQSRLLSHQPCHSGEQAPQGAYGGETPSPTPSPWACPERRQGPGYIRESRGRPSASPTRRSWPLSVCWAAPAACSASLTGATSRRLSSEQGLIGKGLVGLVVTGTA